MDVKLSYIHRANAAMAPTATMRPAARRGLAAPVKVVYGAVADPVPTAVVTAVLVVGVYTAVSRFVSDGQLGLPGHTGGGAIVFMVTLGAETVGGHEV